MNRNPALCIARSPLTVDHTADGSVDHSRADQSLEALGAKEIENTGQARFPLDQGTQELAHIKESGNPHF